MGQIWAIGIVGVMLVLFTAGLLRWTQQRGRHAAIGVSIGALGGAVGAFLILRPRFDVVPDAAEDVAVAALIVLGSLGLIMITWVRWTRR